MRIGIPFHTFDPYLSGVAIYTLGLIRSLLHFTHLKIMVFTNAADLLHQHIAQHPNLIIETTPTIRTRTRRILWEHTMLPYLAKKHRLNLLHCPGYISPAIPGPVPSVVTIHDTIALDHPRWCKPTNALYYNLMLKPTLQRATQIIAVSKQTANDIHRHVPSVHKKTTVVSPGIDPIFHNVATATQCYQVRRRYNCPEKYILYVGNLEPKKNILNILHAYLMLRRQNFSAKLVIVGQRSWSIQNQLQSALADFSPAEVHFTGYVDRTDLPAIYQSAQLFLFPSLTEGFGFPPLEAMASRIPVIASNRGALAETLAGAAVTVDPQSPRQIAQAAWRLNNDPDLRQQCIHRGLKRSQYFNWQKTIVELLKIYSKVTSPNENRLPSHHLALANGNLRGA